MKNHKRAKTYNRLVHVLLILLLSLAITQTIQAAYGQNNATSNNKWAMSLFIENGQNGSNITFTPFDQIQLIANVTYGNATQPDILVYFNVTGPANAPSPNRITRIETTNSSGKAGFSFRLPIQSENESSLVGTWQASATIQTTNGTIQKNLTFSTKWNMEITSINLLDSQGTNQTVFSPGNTVGVQLTINNTGEPQTANVTLNMQDPAGNIINQTQFLNSKIDTSTNNATQLQTDLQIPDGTGAGHIAINVAIYSGTYNGTNIPAAENQTAYFTIASNTTVTATPTPTPTPTPTSGPTPTPYVIENSVSLFSWLLVATGLFTFTSLFMFLKRKPMPKINTQMPNLPPTIPGPTTSAPLFQLQQSSATTETPNIASQGTVDSSFKLTSPQQALESQVLTNLNRISETANRIQALKAELKLEREQLAKDLSELNKTVEEQQRSVKSYFDAVKSEIEKLEALLTDKDITPPSPQPPKPPQQKNESTEKKE
jgi:hypothetical protein